MLVDPHGSGIILQKASAGDGAIEGRHALVSAKDGAIGKRELDPGEVQIPGVHSVCGPGMEDVVDGVEKLVVGEGGFSVVCILDSCALMDH